MARLFNLRRLMQMREIEVNAMVELNAERRRLRDSQNAFELPEETFKSFFRVNRDIALYLCNTLSPTLKRRRRCGLSVRTQVLVTLRFLAEGSYQKGVGQDFFIAISQPSTSRCIKAVTNAMVEILLDEWVSFPQTNQQKAVLEQGFHGVIGFPGVIGAIDCTHIAIVTPKDHEESYKNHKGFYSLNVQMICDSRMSIMNVTCYPGTVHDNFIWTYCHARTQMRRSHENRMGHYYLIGDAGYALEEWLLTPLPHAVEGTPEHRYTRSLCTARSVIERAFGLLKARWRCLLRDRVLHYRPQVACKIIVACVILHNIMIFQRMPDMELLPLQEIDNPPPADINNHRAAAQRNQAAIIRQYFT